MEAKTKTSLDIMKELLASDPDLAAASQWEQRVPDVLVLTIRGGYDGFFSEWHFSTLGRLMRFGSYEA